MALSWIAGGLLVFIMLLEYFCQAFSVYNEVDPLQSTRSLYLTFEASTLQKVCPQNGNRCCRFESNKLVSKYQYTGYLSCFHLSYVSTSKRKRYFIFAPVKLGHVPSRETLPLMRLLFVFTYTHNLQLSYFINARWI